MIIPHVADWHGNRRRGEYLDGEAGRALKPHDLNVGLEPGTPGARPGSATAAPGTPSGEPATAAPGVETMIGAVGAAVVIGAAGSGRPTSGATGSARCVFATSRRFPTAMRRSPT